MNTNSATSKDAFYHDRRREFANVVDQFVGRMKEMGNEEAQMRTHIGIYDINCLTSTVHLVDRPDSDTIENMPKLHRDQYEMFCKIAKEVWMEKGFNFLEY